ncbi:MAG: hypothetical protein ACTHOO_01985 [Alcanivorax sp.]
MVDDTGNIRSFNAGNPEQKKERELQGVLTKYGHGNLVNDSYNDFISNTGIQPDKELERAYKRTLTLKYGGVDESIQSASKGANANNPIVQGLVGHLIPSKEAAFKSRAIKRANELHQFSEDFLGDQKPSSSLNVANLLSPTLDDLYYSEASNFTNGLDERSKQIIETIFKLDSSPDDIKDLNDQEAKLLYLLRVSEELDTRTQAAEFLSEETGLNRDDQFVMQSFLNFVNDELKPNFGDSALEKKILKQSEELRQKLSTAKTPEDHAQLEKEAIEAAPNVTSLHND